MTGNPEIIIWTTPVTAWSAIVQTIIMVWLVISLFRFRKERRHLRFIAMALGYDVRAIRKGQVEGVYSQRPASPSEPGKGQFLVGYDWSKPVGERLAPEIYEELAKVHRA